MEWRHELLLLLNLVFEEGPKAKRKSINIQDCLRLNHPTLAVG